MTGKSMARTAALLVATALATCGAPPADTIVTIAPDITFALPSPAALGGAVEARQLITARHGDQTYVFETLVSATASRLLVVGSDMLGRRAMTLTWDGRTLDIEAAAWLPPELPARNIIADIMLVHWPLSAVRAGLGPPARLDAPTPDRREVRAGDRLVIAIDGPAAGWTGRWRYHHVGYDYTLDIQSVAAP